jgi:hypothetical protein
MAEATTNKHIARFLDVGDEPKRTLLPIRGYEKEPLVTLEEAVQPLQSLLTNLNSMVWTAKRNSSKPSDGLTSDESAAIQLYTMQWDFPDPSLHYLLNRTLRSERRESLRPWFRYMKLLLTALYKLPSTKSTVWRGIQGDVSGQYSEDQIWWGLSSCTETIHVVQSFLGPSGKRTLFAIECIHGKSIRAHSFYTKENEILLMPGTYLRIVSKVNPTQELCIIHLRQERPPFVTIARPFDLPAPNAPLPNRKKSATPSLPQATPTPDKIPVHHAAIPNEKYMTPVQAPPASPASNAKDSKPKNSATPSLPRATPTPDKIPVRHAAILNEKYMKPVQPPFASPAGKILLCNFLDILLLVLKKRS